MMQPESIPPASNSAIIVTNLIRMVSVLSNAGSSRMRTGTDGSPPTFDVPPRADVPAHAPLDGVPSSADHTHRHPNRLAEPQEIARQVGLPRDEPPPEPPFRLPASQELQSQP